MQEHSGTQKNRPALSTRLPPGRIVTFNIRQVYSQVESRTRRRSMAEKLNFRLYEKYCSSQNFYYTKEIDNILCGIKSAGSIQFAEEVAYSTEAERKEEMLKRTNIPEAPWHIVEAVDKKRARLNCIDHLLHQIPYEPIPHEEISLPDRAFNPSYERSELPKELFVPSKY